MDGGGARCKYFLPTRPPIEIGGPPRISFAFHDAALSNACMADARHFRSYVAGVKHSNADGSSRNRLVAKLEVFDVLQLEHEPGNPHDPNAVRVLRHDGRQIGYLPRDVAANVARKIEQGYSYACFVDNVTEDYDGDRTSRYVDLLIVEARPGVSSQEAQKYVDKHVQPELASESGQRQREAGCAALILSAVSFGLLLAAMACGTY